MHDLLKHYRDKHPHPHSEKLMKKLHEKVEKIKAPPRQTQPPAPTAQLPPSTLAPRAGAHVARELERAHVVARGG